MRISIKYHSYNHRRYGKPWIAIITAWPVGGRPEIRWGRFLSDPGDEGEVEIDAQPGDIVRSGQKDYRGNKTSNDWYIVDNNCELNYSDPQNARRHWDAKQKPVDALDELASMVV